MFFNISYWEWFGYIIGIILVLGVSLPNGYLKKWDKFFSHENLHHTLPSNEIERMVLLIKERTDHQDIPVTEKETQQIMSWFNEAVFIDRANVSIPDYRRGIRMETKQEWVEIKPFAQELLIQRGWKDQEMKPVSYWARQPELRNWLDAE